MHDPALIDRWVDDTVDLIEFANGGTDTEWGAKRAALGHPEPFGLDMIGLGNEENTTTFEANFPKFRDAIEAKYPDIKIISNSGPDDSGARFDTLWDYNRAQKVDLVDEHYYRDPSLVPGEQPPLRHLRPRPARRSSSVSTPRAATRCTTRCPRRRT